jgi:RNA polymerase sigma factor for flagellar operon FliA
VTYQLYTDHADVIEAVLSHICGTRRLVADTCQEFSSWVRLRLLENDSAILRKFSGRSSPRTFLMTVIQRLYLDWRNREWGKWRPSAAARRAGPVAAELERLVLRDQVSFDEAVTQLQAQGLTTSRDECDRIWATLPQRPARRVATDVDLDGTPAADGPSDLAVAEQQRRAEQAGEALTDVLTSLDAGDHVILRLRYQDGFTVARIAQLMGHDQKALYRRFEQILNQMRQALLARGVSAADLTDVLGSPLVDFPAAFARSARETGNRSV